MATGLAHFFRLGTPVFAALVAIDLIPWWLVLAPVAPAWVSFVASRHEASMKARIIRVPRRPMSLDEAASERRYLFAHAALDTATQARAEALLALAVARKLGDAESSTTLPHRRRTLIERVRR